MLPRPLLLALWYSLRLTFRKSWACEIEIRPEDFREPCHWKMGGLTELSPFRYGRMRKCNLGPWYVKLLSLVHEDSDRFVLGVSGGKVWINSYIYREGIGGVTPSECRPEWFRPGHRMIEIEPVDGVCRFKLFVFIEDSGTLFKVNGDDGLTKAVFYSKRRRPLALLKKWEFAWAGNPDPAPCNIKFRFRMK